MVIDRRSRVSIHRRVVPPTAAPRTRNRGEIPEACKWNVSDIYGGWPEWEGELTRLERLMDRFAALSATLKR